MLLSGVFFEILICLLLIKEQHDTRVKVPAKSLLFHHLHTFLSENFRNCKTQPEKIMQQ